MVRVKTDRGKTFEACQWQGDRSQLPTWAKDFRTEEVRFYGKVLRVGEYYVKVGSWVLRGDERGDVFPVPGDMFESIYTPANEVGA